MEPQFLARLRLTSITAVVAFIFLFAMYPRTIDAQGAKNTKSLPSVIGAGTFKSSEGRFSITLPAQPQALPLTLQTAVGLATGKSYQREMKEGTFKVSYVEAGRPLDDAETSKLVLANLSDVMNQFAKANQGKVVIEKRIELGKHPGMERRLELFMTLMIQRQYLVSNRLYQIDLFVDNKQRAALRKAIGVLNSFKILNEPK